MRQQLEVNKPPAGMTNNNTTTNIIPFTHYMQQHPSPMIPLPHPLQRAATAAAAGTLLPMGPPASCFYATAPSAGDPAMVAPQLFYHHPDYYPMSFPHQSAPLDVPPPTPPPGENAAVAAAIVAAAASSSSSAAKKRRARTPDMHPAVMSPPKRFSSPTNMEGSSGVNQPRRFLVQVCFTVLCTVQCIVQCTYLLGGDLTARPEIQR